VPHGFYSYLGAQDGKYYGENNRNNFEGLKLINDFVWLESEFNRIKERLSGR
jgi:hypothetical protein